MAVVDYEQIDQREVPFFPTEAGTRSGPWNRAIKGYSGRTRGWTAHCLVNENVNVPGAVVIRAAARRVEDEGFGRLVKRVDTAITEGFGNAVERKPEVAQASV